MLPDNISKKFLISYDILLFNTNSTIFVCVLLIGIKIYSFYMYFIRVDLQI